MNIEGSCVVGFWTHCTSLTHIQLSYEAGHIAVLEIQRQNILGEVDLVRNDEATSILFVRDGPSEILLIVCKYIFPSLRHPK